MLFKIAITFAILLFRSALAVDNTLLHLPAHFDDPTSVISQTSDLAAKAVKQKLQKELGDAVVVEPRPSTLNILHGQALQLALEAGDPPAGYRYLSGPPAAALDSAIKNNGGTSNTWKSVRSMLPRSLGGVLSRGNWKQLETQLFHPIRHGASLPDFVLEGPLDIFFTPPSSVQLWLPHAVDSPSDNIRRVMLRAGAAVTVRGARKVSLRRPLDLPSISLSEFAAFATEDKDRHSSMGLMHLAAGLRTQAELRWNNTLATADIGSGHTSGSSAKSAALVAFDLEMAENGSGALLAAPVDHNNGMLRRLRARSVSAGVLELTAKDPQQKSKTSTTLSEKDSKALALSPESPYMWPLRDAHPDTIYEYETLIREVLASQIFAPPSAGGGGGAGGAKEGLRLASDVPLRLRSSSAEAVMLISMEIDVLRQRQQDTQAAAKRKKIVGDGDNSVSSSSATENSTPTPEELMIQAVTSTSRKRGPEVWNVVAKLEGNAAKGLKLVPLALKQINIGADTATFAKLNYTLLPAVF